MDETRAAWERDQVAAQLAASAGHTLNTPRSRSYAANRGLAHFLATLPPWRSAAASPAKGLFFCRRCITPFMVGGRVCNVACMQGDLRGSGMPNAVRSHLICRRFLCAYVSHTLAGYRPLPPPMRSSHTLLGSHHHCIPNVSPMHSCTIIAWPCVAPWAEPSLAPLSALTAVVGLGLPPSTVSPALRACSELQLNFCRAVFLVAVLRL